MYWKVLSSVPDSVKVVYETKKSGHVLSLSDLSFVPLCMSLRVFYFSISGSKIGISSLLFLLDLKALLPSVKYCRQPF